MWNISSMQEVEWSVNLYPINFMNKYKFVTLKKSLIICQFLQIVTDNTLFTY